MTRFLTALMACAALSMPLQACAQIPETTVISSTANMFDGIWENDRGSQVTFTVKDGMLSGYYQTNVGQPDKSQKFDLTGYVQNDQITFTVNFGKYGSMTSWTGQMSKDEAGDYIRTLWHLTRDVPDAEEDKDLWKSITAGASTFRPVPAK